MGKSEGDVRTRVPAVRDAGEIAHYKEVYGDVATIIAASRRLAARSVNSAMTATYWLIGRRIVEFEQSGEERAEYGGALMERLADDLTGRFGRGYSSRTMYSMRLFYLTHPPEKISPTLSAEFSPDTIREGFGQLLATFPLPWSAYLRLLSVKDERAREFYETEALRGGWSVRQLDRQIGSQFYERTALSRNKAAMLTEGGRRRPGDAVLPEEEIKDPLVLEFLDLKDEYSESDLEEALIARLETFLMEMGPDFCFVARQRGLRIGDSWYRVDLLLYHRRLRCLVIVDLKIGKFSHADAGQMNVYLNYAREHWMVEGENPPVGLILCSARDDALAHYALDGLPNSVMAGEYKVGLPDADVLEAELRRTRRALDEEEDAAEPDDGTYGGESG